jgi:hypothetical protein
MDTIEIYRDLLDVPTFAGVFASDVLPVHPLPGLVKYTLIINTNVCTEPGSHWVAVHLDTRSSTGYYLTRTGSSIHYPQVTRTRIPAAKSHYTGKSAGTIQASRRICLRAKWRGSDELRSSLRISVSLCAIWRTLWRDQQIPVTAWVCVCVCYHLLILFFEDTCVEKQ